jgi:hypothetical protein
MNYRVKVSEIARINRPDIEADLAQARAAHARVVGEVRDLERAIAGLEGLIELGRSADEANSAPTGMTLHEAMREVLRSAPSRMMRAQDLAAEIERRHLYRMRDGRAAEPQQIHARTGNYPDLFEREGTFIKLR